MKICDRCWAGRRLRYGRRLDQGPGPARAAESGSAAAAADVRGAGSARSTAVSALEPAAAGDAGNCRLRRVGTHFDGSAVRAPVTEDDLQEENEAISVGILHPGDLMIVYELSTGTTADAALPASPATPANVFAEPAFDLPKTLTFAAALAFAGSLWSLDADLLSDVCAWIWCENQVAAAIKLVPLGHSDGQRLLLSLADELPALTAQARGLRDQDLGVTATGMALCSAAHETLPARLFRS